jgi:membrane-bound inhibitor of C-type lysozyme
MSFPLVRPAVAAAFSVLLAGCGSVNLWPFGSEGMAERSRTPANATEFQCDGGKRFHVRYLEGGAAWVILPEREFRLDKAEATAGARYASTNTSLEINGNEAILRDGPANVYRDCRSAAAPGG